MRIVDTNVLLYAVNPAAAHHGAARDWLADAVPAPELLGIPWVVGLKFVRIATRAQLFPRPLSAGQAVGVLRGLLDEPGVTVPAPTPAHPQLLADLLAAVGTGAATSWPMRTSRPWRASTTRQS